MPNHFHLGSWGSLTTSGGVAGFGPVFGFGEAVADSLELVTEPTGANEARSAR
jgi:hypothetical protein